MLKVVRHSNFLEKLILRTLSSGPVPNHVAIIMDGNRRYAREHNIQNNDSYMMGSETIQRVLLFGSELGCKEVSFFTFSIENFKRGEAEVDSIMNLALSKAKELYNERDQLAKNGVCIRVYGDIQLLPVEIQKMIAEIMLLTRNGDKFFVNFNIAYTGRHDIAQAIDKIKIGLRKGLILKSDVTKELFDKCLYSRKSSEIDCLIRTSGEIRLSDYYLWQTNYAVLVFINTLWPMVGIWSAVEAIIKYQQNYHLIRGRNERINHEKALAEKNEDPVTKQRISKFFEFLDEMEVEFLKKIASGDTYQKKVPEAEPPF